MGSDFTLAGERICGGSLITFCSAALTTKSEFSSSASTIHIDLLGPDSIGVWPSSKGVAWNGLGF